MEFQRNVLLKNYSNFKIGGPAKYFCEATSVEKLREALIEAKKLGEPIFILGGGYNLLISDKGFNGIVIRPALQGISLVEPHAVRVGAGVLISELLHFCIEHELIGLHWAGGLPSTVGGAIWGNAGAFGGETKDRIQSVVTCNVVTCNVRTWSQKECEFGYRTSVFKTKAKDEVITEVVFELEKGEGSKIKELVEEKKEYRRLKQPLEYPNIGSIFKNVPVEKVPPAVLKEFEGKIKQDPFPVLPTAVLTAAAGLKEYRVGDAMVSPKHSNFIVNAGSATAGDVKAVMAHIKQVIKEKYGIELEQEVIFVGE